MDLSYLVFAAKVANSSYNSPCCSDSEIDETDSQDDVSSVPTSPTAMSESDSHSHGTPLTPDRSEYDALLTLSSLFRAKATGNPPEVLVMRKFHNHVAKQSALRVKQAAPKASLATTPKASFTVTSTSSSRPMTAQEREYIDDGPPKPFACVWEGCNKAFPRKADLTRHYRIHQNIRPFACSFENCGRSFTQRSALKVHSRIHSGEKPHVCPYDGCDRMFSDSSSLARHRKLHTPDGMTYICNEPNCALKFSKKVYLLRHRKQAHSGVVRSSVQGMNSPPSKMSAYPTPPKEQDMLATVGNISKLPPLPASHGQRPSSNLSNFPQRS